MVAHENAQIHTLFVNQSSTEEVGSFNRFHMVAHQNARITRVYLPSIAKSGGYKKVAQVCLAGAIRESRIAVYRFLRPPTKTLQYLVSGRAICHKGYVMLTS